LSISKSDVVNVKMQDLFVKGVLENKKALLDKEHT